jgi:hypothetical protein
MPIRELWVDASGRKLGAVRGDAGQQVPVDRGMGRLSERDDTISERDRGLPALDLA